MDLSIGQGDGAAKGRCVRADVAEAMDAAKGDRCDWGRQMWSRKDAAKKRSSQGVAAVDASRVANAAEAADTSRDRCGKLKKISQGSARRMRPTRAGRSGGSGWTITGGTLLGACSMDATYCLFCG
ncbi:hypothetical protein GUJ93_ZPchr0004g38753 [Zizania palustris]|uniref:Uncharacterized protein n=1 Tax=Zizania palustris TaxID=103762 RepID=A0A8J5SIU2_ZIZPA|nr:hypothetical protein GUJ93_ZPchr0004g38753 [Zizania palustris]